MGGENAQHRFSPGLETRLIPAHAGKTSSEPLSLASRPAHPHSRRENRPMTIVRPIHTGSSPLTRGKHARDVGGAFLQGLIPAHAGKTARSPCALAQHEAHPRSRGENRSRVDLVRQPCGSSPLTRGKLRSPRPAPTQMGLIPAHAGKTRRSLGSLRTGWAHPRSRGENCCVL